MLRYLIGYDIKVIRFISFIIFFMCVRSNSDFEENDSNMELIKGVEWGRILIRCRRDPVDFLSDSYYNSEYIAVSEPT